MGDIIRDYFKQEILPDVIAELNEVYAPKRLARRSEEKLPTEKKALSAFRSRVGFSLENALGDIMHETVCVKFPQELNVSENVINEFPDLHVRNHDDRLLLLGIEIKSLDIESEEQAARLEAAVSEIADNDYLFVIAWQWHNEGDLIFPRIMEWLFIKAKPLAIERDKRLRLTGGCIRQGRPMVKAKKTKKLVPDPGNYGKFMRLVHKTRMKAISDSDVLQYLKFIEKIRGRK